MVYEEVNMPGIRGTRPKTAEMHKMLGTYQPCRHADIAKPADGEAVAPEWLSDVEKAHFEYFKQTIKDIGCDSSSYAAALITLAQVYAERNRLKDEAEETGGPVIKSGGLLRVNPMYKLYMEQDKRLLSLLAEFGLTPVSMCRLKGIQKPKKEDDNPFDKLLTQ